MCEGTKKDERSLRPLLIYWSDDEMTVLRAVNRRYTVTVTDASRRDRPLAEYENLAEEEAWELAVVFRLLGYPPEAIRVELQEAVERETA